MEFITLTLVLRDGFFVTLIVPVCAIGVGAGLGVLVGDAVGVLVGVIEGV